LLNHHQLWRRPNANTVSVGHLVLHLSGNVGQWINANLGNRPDHRQRQQQFDLPCMDRRQLMDHLNVSLVHAIDMIRRLSCADLERTWNVQGFQGSGLAILLRVVEHFSYPVGRITLHTKLMQDMDTGCYASLDLEGKGSRMPLDQIAVRHRIDRRSRLVHTGCIGKLTRME
jgi:hypothetical protein